MVSHVFKAAQWYCDVSIRTVAQHHQSQHIRRKFIIGACSVALSVSDIIRGNMFKTLHHTKRKLINSLFYLL